MIRSMTGFGRGKYESNGRDYLVEIKSVNHKYCDIGIRLPRTLNGIECRIRKEVASKIARGKIDIYIEVKDNYEDDSSIYFNKNLAKIYINNLIEIAKENEINYDLNIIDIVKMPDVLKLQENNNEEIIFNEIIIAVKDAINNIVDMKEIEGEKLKEDIIKRLDCIDSKISKIIENSTGLVEEYIVKLNERIKEILQTDIIDENRLAQEVVIYSDKISIEEEITRLKSHSNQFRELLNESFPVGKKLDFLVQEINRELNTIASKSNNLNITNLVVDLKTEIENIREQIQNIE